MDGLQKKSGAKLEFSGYTKINHDWVSYLRAIAWVVLLFGIIGGILLTITMDWVTGLCTICSSLFLSVLFNIICIITDYLYSIRVNIAGVYKELKKLNEQNSNQGHNNS